MLVYDELALAEKILQQTKRCDCLHKTRMI